MKSKKRWGLSIILWLLFAVLTAGIFYLSFQSGERAKLMDSALLHNLPDWQQVTDGMAQEQLDLWIYRARQSGRILAFLLLGMVGTLAVQISCQRWSWLLRTGVTGLGLGLIAFLAEKLKVYIPSRHYSREEMLLSFAAAAAGFLTVAAATLAFQCIKGILRFMTGKGR